MLYSDPAREVDSLLKPVGDADLEITDEYGFRTGYGKLPNPPQLKRCGSRCMTRNW